MRHSTKAIQARPGFSLIETLVALAISGLVIAVFFGTIVNLLRQHRGQRDAIMAEDALRSAELTLRTILQAAEADPLNTGQALIDPNPLAAGSFNNLRVKSDFNPADGDFTDNLEDITVKVVADTLLVKWIAGGSFVALAYPIEAISFAYFSAAGTALTTSAAVANATSVRFTVSAQESPISSTLRSRNTWVFLQNRR